MRKRPRRSPLANAPPQHAPGMPPKHGRIPLSPPIDLMAAPMAVRPTPVPRQRPLAEVPHPRRPPRAVRVVDGGDLRDLFAVFPDLPRPPRTPSRAMKLSPLLRFRTRHR